MIMSRQARARMARLESALERVERAEERALAELRSAGFLFASVTEAKYARAEYRESLRLQASAIERMNNITNRRAS